ncbi:MAG: LTA synthase family protein, partial [Tannerellaceae bacterium]|nr:LTA synthase family protein [Tannerellaceae bacterium]
MKKQIVFLVSCYLTLLLFFVLTKPLFLWYYMEKGAYGVQEFLRVAGYGLKLDSTVAAYFTVFPLLLVILSVWWHRKGLNSILQGYWMVTAFLLTVIFCVDFALYDYWKFRLDATVLFYLDSPTNALASVTTGQIVLWVGLAVGVFLLLY